MVQVVRTLVQELVHDVDVVLRVKDVEIRLDSLLVKASQLADLLHQTPDLALLYPERLQVDLLGQMVQFAMRRRLLRGRMYRASPMMFCFAEIAFEQTGMTIENQLFDLVPPLESLRGGDLLMTVPVPEHRSPEIGTVSMLGMPWFAR